MFGISGGHLLILAIVLLVFGPKRLPELGSTLGSAIRNFKSGLSGALEPEQVPVQIAKSAEAAPVTKAET